jgi:hypothetical protein
VQHYRDDLAEAHPGVDPGAFEEMTLNFADALLLEMERCVADHADNSEAKANRGASLSPRHRVIAALGQLLAAHRPAEIFHRLGTLPVAIACLLPSQPFRISRHHAEADEAVAFW